MNNPYVENQFPTHHGSTFAGSNITVVSQWFNGQNVKLDGWIFKSCRFDRCVLFVDTLEFTLLNCFLDPSTQFVLGEKLAKVVKAYNWQRQYSRGGLPPIFDPIWNQDGTVTIANQG
ncbi:hypothetical protein [Pseudomonas sp. Marseille-QA0892]